MSIHIGSCLESAPVGSRIVTPRGVIPIEKFSREDLRNSLLAAVFGLNIYMTNIVGSPSGALQTSYR
ncbi:MAG: hypothetical protein WA813_12550 [Beijerinckiaceae bacterium]